ncbi:hypothetical protein [Cyanobacterium sp. uoEpiScrs1]|uniref:hypothetical protein n=1 Tax=Cyanobacterium sp. uoEpiScrs1 TaxID=2976343 RepID=UPI00226A9D2E|nr:hypothetical protein [Cyanobacterium sp. uoEpiScrs1]
MTIQTLTYSSLQNHQTSIKSLTQQWPQTEIEKNSVRQLSTSYQTIQQLKYLHLEAEIDVLLQELHTMKRNNQTES